MKGIEIGKKVIDGKGQINDRIGLVRRLRRGKRLSNFVLVLGGNSLWVLDDILVWEHFDSFGGELVGILVWEPVGKIAWAPCDTLAWEHFGTLDGELGDILVWGRCGTPLWGLDRKLDGELYGILDGEHYGTLA